MEYYNKQVTKKLNEVADVILEYIEENGLDRYSFTMYKQIQDLEIKSKTGVSLNKSTFTRKGFKSSDVLKLVNPILKERKTLRDLKEVLKANNQTLENIDSTGVFQRHKITIKCNICEYVEYLTVHSYLRREFKCKKCTGQAPWKDREEEFLEIAESLGCMPIYKEFDLIINKEVILRCLKCNLKVPRKFAQVVFRKSFECPNCSPRAEKSRGSKATIDGYIFDSQIEAYLYEKLKELGLAPYMQVHIPYSQLCNTEAKYISDFVVFDRLVVEVTSFTKANNPEYYENMKKKQELLKNSKYSLLFINTLADVLNLNTQDIVYSL